MFLMRRQSIYWIVIFAAGIVTCVPYSWSWLFGVGASTFGGEFLPPILWLALFIAAFRVAGTSKRRRWLPLLMAPVVFWPGMVTAFTFLMWKLHGFAP